MRSVAAIPALVLLLGFAQTAPAAVVIDENFDTGTATGTFTVHVTADPPLAEVGWFAVKNDAAGSAGANRFGWVGEVITAADWAAGYSFYIFGTLDTGDYPWPELTNDPNGSAFFYYAVYLGGGVGGSDITAGSSQGGFSFAAALPASPWIAGNGLGNIVVYGNTTLVPIPAVTPIFVLALGGLLRTHRRRLAGR